VAILKLLPLALVATIAACYRPDARDCTVSCSGADECIDGQVCGADGWCAAPDVAGTCGDEPGDDAAVADAPVLPDDAALPDAAPPDAAGAELHVVVSGRGKVIIEPLGVECAGMQGAPGDCTFPAAPDLEVTLLPTDTHPQDTFAGWTTANCEASPGACVLTVTAPVTLVGASFE
jgi:hypothetical protein